MDNTNPLSFIFNGNDPNVNSQLRQRIALAMMAKQKRYPKTFGEGLSAIGESLGEIGTARQLEQQDLAQQKAAAAYGGGTDSTTTPPATRASYAPPDQDVAPAATPAAAPTEPAAPTALSDLPLANNSEGLTNTPPGGQASMLNPNLMLNKPVQTPPAGQFTPRDRIAAALAPSEGGYNILDAQTGMPRVGTARGQAMGERAYPGNPDMQAYASQLNAAEQPKPGDTSSTGARGGFQFIPSTAKQYGLTNPDDDMASADAMKALTADNATAFERINGRPPSMADLALMHQQGGVTGARMAGGTGNASPANLAVNNIPPSAGPAAAAAKIKSFYGMPERPVDPRQAIAEAMAPKPPVMAFDGQASPNNAPLPLQQPQQQIRQAPPPAQAASPYTQQKPVAPQPTPISDIEKRLTIDAQNNPYLAPKLQAIQAARAAADARNIEEYKANLQHYNAVDLEGRKYNAAKPKTQAEIDHLNAQIAEGKVRTQAARAQDISGKVIMGDDGVYRRPKIEGSNSDAMPTAKLTKEQGDSVKFLTQMHLMGEQLKGKEKILAEGLKDEVAGKVPFVGNSLMSRQYRMAKTAAETWVQANLRDISGAVIGTAEHTKQMQLLMPRYGDTAEDLTRKAQARNAIERGMYSGLGTDDARQVADYNKRQNIKELTDKRNEINAEMHKHFPNVEKGTTKYNPKTKKTRVFDGENWLEAD